MTISISKGPRKAVQRGKFILAIFAAFGVHLALVQATRPWPQPWPVLAYVQTSSRETIAGVG
jgi:hypothetical protein